MKKLTSILLILALALTLTACGSSKHSPAPAPAPANGDLAPASVANKIIEMDGNGAESCSTPDGSRKWIAGFRTEVVDTTGAGDSFCAGFCYGLVNDYPIERAIRFGNAAGAFCVSAMGASAGIPPAAEIDAFLASHT